MQLRLFGNDNISGSERLFAAFLRKQQAIAGRVDMGWFATSSVRRESSEESPAIFTCGAGPCVIIIVQCKDGTGAMGHCPGEFRVNAVLYGLWEMLNTLQAAAEKLDAIVFAAGEQDPKFRKDVVEATKSQLKTEVVWPEMGLEYGDYSSCIFFPKEFQAGFWEDKVLYGNWFQFKGQGLEKHSYQTLAGADIEKIDVKLGGKISDEVKKKIEEDVRRK